MRFIKAMTLLIAVFVLTVMPALARVCPVTGQLATNDFFTDHDGKRVYFSCELAKQDFLNSPAQYMESLKSVHDTDKKAQAFCPVSNEEINRSVWADYNGKRIYLHCNIAKKSFLKNPESYYKKLIDGNVALEDVSPPDLRFIMASEGAGLAN